MVRKEDVIAELGLRLFGSKGWYTSSTTTCKSCGRSDKAGIKFTDNSGKFNCMRCSISESIEKFLIRIGYDHLVHKQESVSLKFQLVDMFSEEKEEIKDEKIKPCKLPVGSVRIQSHPYLEERGFKEYHYDVFKPCISNILYRGYIIYQILNESGNLVAFLARSVQSKEWHKINLEKSKNGEADLFLRYKNSNSDFSKLIGGINEITDKTEEVILVEGLFDKVNTDNNLELWKDESVKCLFTFGSSIKSEQINLLKKYNKVKKIYLLYDYGTIEESKRYGLDLINELNKEVLVCEIKSNNDPGSLECEELIKVLEESVNPLQFKLGKIHAI